MAATQPNTSKKTDKEDGWRRALLFLLLFLLSCICIFCSSQSASLFIDRGRIAASMLSNQQADYQLGILMELAPIDRDRIINEIINDREDLLATPSIIQAVGAPVIIAALPKITPASTSTPIPTSTPTSQPTSAPENTPSPTATPPDPPDTPPPVSSPSPQPSPSAPAPSPTVPLPPTVPPSPTVPLPPSPTIPPPSPTVPPPPSPTADTPTPVSSSNNPPNAVNDPANTNEDTGVIINVLANDSDSDGTIVPGSLTIATGPSNGAVVISGPGQVTYTPSANFNGIDTFTYQICDDDGDCSTATVTITVNPINDPPVAVDDTDNVFEDIAKTISVLTNDSDIDGPSPLQIISVSGPSNGVIQNIGGLSLVYTPTLNFSGTDIFTYTITDGLLTDTATVTLTITAVNDPPVAVDDTDSTLEDTPTAVDVLFNDSDIDGPLPIQILSVGMPANGTTQNINGVSVVYTPTLNFNGTDTFTYTITDGNLTGTAIVTMTIIALNDPPIAVADVYTTTQNVTLTVSAALGVLNNDTDAENDPLTAISVTDPATGTLTLATSGAFTYTPNLGFTGVDSFTYKANDGADSNTVTVTINVN